MNQHLWEMAFITAEREQEQYIVVQGLMDKFIFSVQKWRKYISYKNTYAMHIFHTKIHMLNIHRFCDICALIAKCVRERLVKFSFERKSFLPFFCIFRKIFIKLENNAR